MANSPNSEKQDRRLAAIGLFIAGCYFFRLTRHALSTVIPAMKPPPWISRRIRF